MSTEWLARGALIAGAALFGVGGGWAFFDPSSFYAHVATFPPYNRHLLHDAGAFQLGLAAAAALGLTRLSSTAVALWTAAVASVAHAASHVIDHGLGGRDSDPVVLSVMASAFLAAAVLGARRDPPGRRTRGDATAPPPARIPADRSARTPQHH